MPESLSADMCQNPFHLCDEVQRVLIDQDVGEHAHVGLWSHCEVNKNRLNQACRWKKWKPIILDFIVHLKFDRGLSINSGIVSSLISCSIYGVNKPAPWAVYSFYHDTFSPTVNVIYCRYRFDSCKLKSKSRHIELKVVHNVKYCLICTVWLYVNNTLFCIDNKKPLHRLQWHILYL